MTHALFRRQRRRFTVATAATIGALGLLAAMPAHAVVRDDIIARINNNGLAIILLNGAALDTNIIGGSVSLQADDPMCTPDCSHACTYVLNSLRIFLSDFVWNRADHRYNNSYLVVNGPLTIQDFGAGLQIPANTPAEFVWTGYVDDDHTNDRTHVHGTLPNALDLELNPVTQNLTIHGQFQGTVQGVTVDATILATAETPFKNMPPTAVAGADQTICFGQWVHLDASGSTDSSNDTIMDYRWSENGVGLALGRTVDVPLSAGAHTLTLTVRDSFGGQGTDTVAVNVLAGTDLGVEHQISTVNNNACLIVTQYPDSWGPYLHALRIQPQATGVALLCHPGEVGRVVRA